MSCTPSEYEREKTEACRQCQRSIGWIGNKMQELGNENLKKGSEGFKERVQLYSKRIGMKGPGA